MSEVEAYAERLFGASMSTYVCPGSLCRQVAGSTTCWPRTATAVG